MSCTIAKLYAVLVRFTNMRIIFYMSLATLLRFLFWLAIVMLSAFYYLPLKG